MSDIDLAREYAHEVAPGKWILGYGTKEESPFPHDLESVLHIIRACLTLGVPVTDKVTSKAWGVMIEKVADLERRVAALEGAALK